MEKQQQAGSNPPILWMVWLHTALIGASVSPNLDESPACSAPSNLPSLSLFQAIPEM
jgi:hypothetical protein